MCNFHFIIQEIRLNISFTQQTSTFCFIIKVLIVEVIMLDATLSILILVAIIYLIFIILGFVFIMKKRGSMKQTIDPKPDQNFNVRNEQEER